MSTPKHDEPASQNEDNYWRTKYTTLFDRHDKSINELEEKQALLCKVIVKLSITASGFDPHIDNHMLALRDSLRDGVNDKKLQAELNNLTNTLARISDTEDRPQPIDCALVFDFLERLYVNSPQAFNLADLRSQLQNNTFYNGKAFLNALFEAMGPFQLPVQDAESGGREAQEAYEDYIECEVIAAQLLRLMENIEIPELFSEQALELKQKLNTSKPTPLLENLLDDVIALILNIKQHLEQEQQEIDRFLAQLTDRLIDLGSTLTGARSAVLEASLNREKHDQSISDQMKQLQLHSSQATKLEPLKAIINVKLTEITQEIAQQNQNESLQRQQWQQQLDVMNTKLQSMETESAELKSKLQMAESLAMRDTLTGLPNRLAYQEQLTREFSRMQRNGSPLSLVVIDIDFFKSINDNFGHKSGDRTLAIIAKQLSQHCRKYDFPARIGGEEFVILLPNTNKNQAFKIADQLRIVIERTKFNAGGTAIPITISCGIAEFTAEDDADSVFERADQALYQAKQQGRNRCCLG